ncbi:DUF1788 domain-containing protein [Akkermansiaceae bacterium]|nr:DUF1788 domain-containing protein [Akkermansiaceae bacterium]
MSRLDQLIAAYRRHSSIPLKPGLPIAERVWFLVYPPEDERRLRNRIAEFEIATLDEGLSWREIDFSRSFAEWMDTFEDEEERIDCLKEPEITENYAEPGFSEFLAAKIQKVADEVDPSRIERTVFAITGLLELYDFIHVSDILEELGKDVRGILLLFFPGERDNNSYKFIGARTGWNYLATPITLEP